VFLQSTQHAAAIGTSDLRLLAALHMTHLPCLPAGDVGEGDFTFWREPDWYLWILDSKVLLPF